MKNKILTVRLVFLIAGLLLLIIPLIVDACPQEINVVDANCYLNNYYSGLDYTDCDVELQLDKGVEFGYAVVAFYDESNVLIEKQSLHFYENGGKMVTQNVYVGGKVDSFAIENYSFSPFKVASVCIWISIVLLGIFISTLFLSYKEYDYNGIRISVYAGYNKHYLCVDGQKCDEHNTIVFFTPIVLKTVLESRENVEVSISLTNRISTKVNDRLLTPLKTAKKEKTQA